YFSSEKNSQILLLPFTFDAPNILTTDDEEWLSALSAMGYLIESFGKNTYIVKEIPEFVTISEAESFVNDFIDSFAEGVKLNNTIVIDKLITKSCKSAIKAHDMISQEEAEELLRSLKQCRNPFSCPHGRPTFVRFSIREIERMFKRIV
ncbi:MAG: DNA mismatch repair protein MutL, partial [[Eubacterium] sulci]|nr:DNA mismatch repair protein MutL [[Eubacterium] sulci]